MPLSSNFFHRVYW